MTNIIDRARADQSAPVRRAALRRAGARFAAGMLVTLLALTACSAKSTVKPVGAAQSVVDVVSGQTGFHPTDVSCPSGVEAKVGQEFDCHFTGPEGKPYTAHMRITKVAGQEVDFDVKSRPSQS